MKKLLNKKGSVLFLVVVVMSILLVVASATYYIVSNQRQSVEVHYNSEQSYQTAYSVDKTVGGYFTKVLDDLSQKRVSYKDTIFKKMNDLKSGETITASKDLKEFGLGNYDIEIKRKDVSGTDDGVQYFEVKTKAVVDGESTSIVQVWAMTLSAQETKYFTRFLTSTGNRNGDVTLTANWLYGDTYFENPFTFIANPCKVQQSVYSAGTLLDTGLQFTLVDDPKTIEIVVAENYYSDGGAGTSVSIGELYVGRNFRDGVAKVNDGAYEGAGLGNGKQFLIDAGYVMGDLTTTVGNNGGDYFVKGNCYIKASQQSEVANYYINGDLYLGDDEGLVSGEEGRKFIYVNQEDKVKFYVKGDVYFVGDGAYSNSTKCVFYGGNVYNAPAGDNITEKNASVADIISKALKDKGYDDWDAVKRYISINSAKGTYNKWLANEYFEERFAGSPVINLSNPSDPAIQTLPDWDSYVVNINESCTIQPSNWSWGKHYIIVDTDSIDAEKDGALYIKFDANGSDTFTFGPDANNVFLFVKGKNPLVMILPDNTNFKMPSNSFIGHLDVVLQKTGKANLQALLDSKVMDESTYFGNSSGDDGQAGGFFNTLLKVETLKDEDGNVQKDEFDRDKTVQIFDKSKFDLVENPNPHNNIFLVTNGSTNTLDFSAMSTFCGYVYAPNVKMPIDNMMKGVMFFGGLIVGTYSYFGYNAALVFTDPYDDTYGADIVTHLMGICNGGKNPSPSNPGGGQKDVKIYSVGYE